MEEEEAELAAVTEIIPKWIEELQLSYKDDDWIEGLKKKAVEDPRSVHTKVLSDTKARSASAKVAAGENESWKKCKTLV